MGAQMVPVDLRQKKQIAARVQVYLFGTLVLLLAGFLIYDYVNTREQRMAQAELILGVLSPSAVAALAENNPGLADAELKKLAGIDSLLSAVLYNEAGAAVITHSRSPSASGPPSRPETGEFRFDGHFLEASHPLVRDGRTLGTLYLRFSFEGQQDSWRALIFLLLMFAFLAGWAWKSFPDFWSGDAGERVLSHPDSPPVTEPESNPEPMLQETHLTESTGVDRAGRRERAGSVAEEESRLWIEYTQITERMNFEIKMRKRAENILKTHNRILELLTLGHPLNEVLDQVVENLEKQIGPGARGVVYRLDGNGETLELASAPGLTRDCRREMRVFDINRTDCVFVSTVRDNRVVIVEDFKEDDHWPSCREIGLHHGIRSCWLVPVAGPTGEVAGVVGIVSKTPGSPGVEELKHIRSAGFIAGMAITRKRYEDTVKNQTMELVRSSRDLEEFASIASHDLQEPLRKIVSFGEQLKKFYAEKLDEKGNEYLEKMIRGTLRMQQFIDDLLTYSRAGEESGPMKPTDLNRVVREVAHDFEFLIGEKQARLKVGNLPVVPADPVQMRQVFSNLLSNSLKFSREGVNPEIEIESNPSNGSQAEIIFRDNGIGFDDSCRERIFKPFERLNSVSQYGGSGIGLALCKKIVGRHGGTIRAEGRPGEGTHIILALPTT